MGKHSWTQLDHIHNLKIIIGVLVLALAAVITMFVLLYTSTSETIEVLKTNPATQKYKTAYFDQDAVPLNIGDLKDSDTIFNRFCWKGIVYVYVQIDPGMRRSTSFGFPEMRNKGGELTTCYSKKIPIKE